MMGFIDAQRVQGRAVGSIIRVLREQGVKIAARTYRAWRSRQPAARTLSDALVVDAVRDAAWTTDPQGKRKLAPEGLYGRRKMTALIRRTAIPGASFGAVDRAMRLLGLEGVRRTKGIRTTIQAKDGIRAGDLLNRDFTAPWPDHTWVADFTYVRTWAGWVYVAFLLDVFSQRIVAWHAQTSKHVDLVMIPLRIALWQRHREGHPVQPKQLRAHSDAGSQGEFNWSSQHLDGGGVWWRVRGSRGRSLRWVRVGSGRLTGHCGRRCGLLVIRSSNVMSRWCSGNRSPGVCFPRRPRESPAWRRRSVHGGSATLAGCRRST
jgi:transposase InsO family protein